jgi:peptidoglycan/LPS O-acetylase OafA/YrhL
MVGTGQQRDRSSPTPRAVAGTFLAGDGLRALAVLGVLVLHCAIVVSATRHLAGFAGPDEASGQYRGVAGVLSPLVALMRVSIYVFFALSGYLISRPFLAAYTIGTSRPSIRDYAANRALRIVPAFWVVMALYLSWDHAWQAGGAGGVLAALGFAQTFDTTRAAVLPQAWTLNLEVGFYALIGVLVWLAGSPLGRAARGCPRRVSFVLAAIVTAYAGSLLLKHLAGRPIDNSYDIAQYLFAFLPGVALAAVEPALATRLRQSRHGGWWARGALALAAALLTAEVYAPARLHGLHLLLASLGTGALVGAALALQWATGRCWRALDSRPLRWLGVRSYGIYLIHLGLIGHLLARLGGHAPGVTFLLLVGATALLSAAFADLLWRFVERPALRLRRAPAAAGPISRNDVIEATLAVKA